MIFRTANFIVFVLTLLALSNYTEAGFGITPPYVRNRILTPGVPYEQKITMVRGEPGQDARLKILFDVPGVNDWFTTDPPSGAMLPAGESQIPLVVRVFPPRDARRATYTGRILITLETADLPRQGTVGIISGAQVDVDITLTDEKVSGFKVRDTEIRDLEEGHRVWWMYFPGKIVFVMQLENTGNVPVSPDRVRLDLYDVFGKNLRETIYNLNRMKPLAPFSRGVVVAEFPTMLPTGNYVARAYIHAGESISYAGEHSFHIAPYGSLPARDGYGFAGLSLRNWSILAVIVLAFLGIVVLGVIFLRRKKAPSPVIGR